MSPGVLALGLLIGLLVPGWWGLIVVPVSAIGWAMVVGIDGACTDDCLPSAAGIAAANAIVGLALGAAIRVAFVDRLAGRWRGRTPR